MDGINSKSAWELTQRLVKVNFDNRIAGRGRKPDWIARLNFGNPISGLDYDSNPMTTTEFCNEIFKPKVCQ